RPRQQEDRAGAAVCRRLESDAPARLFEQRSRDREAEAAATGPGGEAGRAETEPVVGRNARAGVVDPELNLVMGDAALQEEVSAIGSHRGERVVQDVEQRVPEREAVHHDQRAAPRGPDVDGNARKWSEDLEEREQFLDGGVELEAVGPGGAGPE